LTARNNGMDDLDAYAQAACERQVGLRTHWNDRVISAAAAATAAAVCSSGSNSRLTKLSRVVFNLARVVVQATLQGVI